MELTPSKTPLKRQSSLSNFWPGWSDASSPATPTSHKKLKNAMTPEASARFSDRQLEDQRLMAESTEKERRAQASLRRENSSGKLLDPDDIGRGVKRAMGRGGRPQGRIAK